MNGVIVVNKPIGCTSFDIVYKVRKILKEKVGHTGTLDPLATGVIPILIGKGTKLSNYLIEHDKEYIATLSLGKKTDTLDAEGRVIEEKEVEKTKIEQQIKDNSLKLGILSEAIKNIEEERLAVLFVIQPVDDFRTDILTAHFIGSWSGLPVT